MSKDRSGSRAAGVLWEGVQRLLAQCPAAEPDGTGGASVVDLGGGTGGLAVRIAALGHRVTVVDPSPDALAALERRSAEAGVTDRVRAVQGDAADLAVLLPEAGADLLLCHGVLEVVEDPLAALRSAHAALRPQGLLSLLVAQWTGAVLARALSGHLAQALELAAGPDHRWGPADPLLRRFDRASATDLTERAGFTVTAVEGTRAFSDLVHSSCAESESDLALLHRLDAEAARSEELLSAAGHLHVHARR
ncbi:methyltransferase family protein [Kineococcus xinjiangensis]|uniref:Methyltransferase family protein n=1 Tax=Kineococcus xinjiangensis TaxID=512762 RepID=A0A2S6IM84_9ACTN|nr:methyltransferase domain-containing protein [Kineococcus xinjiangensis]PPK95250.1 methyltransferase family protein [Kineococcus xinjiangensis]